MIHARLSVPSVLSTVFVAATAAAQCELHPGPKLLASDGTGGDVFGLSVAIDAGTIAVGAIWDDDHGFNSGAVYVCEADGQGGWTEVFKIVPADGDPEDVFGRSVAVHGDTILVGANADDDRGFDAGAGYVFVRSGDAWIQQAKLLPSDGAAVDRVGWSVDLDGDTAVLSGHRNDDAGSSSGSAYVFVRSPDDTWTQQAKLTAADAAAGDEFGHDVAVSGETIIVGAYKDDDHGSSSGSVYVFDRGEGGAWQQTAKLTASDANSGYHFGRFIDLDGETALIGSPFHHPLNYGAAYVLRRTDGAWSEEAVLFADVPTTQEWFGSDVCIDGTTAVVGSFYGEGNHPGEAYAFRDAGDGWALVANPTAADGAIGDGFGRHLGLDEGAIVIGASADDDQGVDSGAAYTFALECAGSAPGDVTGDGIVNVQDLNAVLIEWGACPAPSCAADLNEDGVIDVQDLIEVLQHWT
ncbi:MAG: hypothetical protein ACYTGR_15280 [Planctomycetota bacterium]|jgi:hypothetical protein